MCSGAFVCDSLLDASGSAGIACDGGPRTFTWHFTVPVHPCTSFLLSQLQHGCSSNGCSSNAAGKNLGKLDVLGLGGSSNCRLRGALPLLKFDLVAIDVACC